MSKYLETKSGSIEQAVLEALNGVSLSETNKNNKSDDGEGLDAVQPKAVKKKFADRKDKDIDNDGDTDSSDEFLHKKRKAISKAINKKEGNAFTGALNAAKEKGDTTFVVAGKKYKVEDHQTESAELDEAAQILAHGGKGQYKVVKNGSVTQIKFKGKVVGTADFDRGSDSFFVSIKGEKGQKSFDDAQAMADYFAKNKITEGTESLDEAFSSWTVTILKTVNKIKKGDSKSVKAQNVAQALKKAAKAWGDDNLNSMPSTAFKVTKDTSESVESVSNMSRYVAEIAKQWGEAADKEDEKKKVMCEDCGKVHEGACAEEKDGTTMTGKPMDKVEVSVKEKD